MSPSVERIRRARSADWPAILGLLTASGLPTSDLAPEHVECFRVATEAERVVGCVAVEPYGSWGLLRSLAVAPEARGCGLGGALERAALDHARGTGLSTLVLLTDTAERFFLSRGWAPLAREAVPETVRRSGQFSGGCPSCAACLMRTVGEGSLASPP
ncbi:MAG: arsenic resistance N-acetyltransferase ArsN2 [Bacteroidota bacterium]